MAKKTKEKKGPKIMTGKLNKLTHIVKVKRDNVFEWPDLWSEVYLSGENEAENRRFIEMFGAHGRCRIAKNPDVADFVVFGGGADVDPALYGEEPHKTTHTDPARDRRDLELFTYCYNEGIPMLGICRGAQFGHVMLGGKLYQDVDGHHGDHFIYLPDEKRVINPCSSVHHQMCMDNTKGGMHVLATCNKSTSRHCSPTVSEKGSNSSKDIEAFVYRQAAFLGVQGHPEYRGYLPYQKWVLELVKELLVESPDLLRLESGYRRLRPEILNRRPKIELPKLEGLV